MFELVPNELLDTLCVFVVVLVALYNYFCIKNNKKGTGYLFFIIIIFLYSLFYRPAIGDFWNYLNVYKQGSNVPYRHMEDFYYWLMDHSANNYLLWRTLIWFPTAIIIAYIFRLLKVSSNYATFFFLIYGLSAYYYTRNALALSLLYFGMVVFCNRKNFYSKILNTLLLVGLIYLSWNLHKSMPLYIVYAILAIVLPFNKKNIIGALIAFPVLYGLMVTLANNFLTMADIWLSNKGMYYLEAENTFSANWKGTIRLLIKYVPVFYFYVVAFRKPISKESENYLSYKVFLLFSFLIVYSSFLFLGQGSAAIQGRLYKSAMIPFSFVASMYFMKYMGTKQCNTFIYLVVIYYASELFFNILGV